MCVRPTKSWYGNALYLGAPGGRIGGISPEPDFGEWSSWIRTPSWNWKLVGRAADEASARAMTEEAVDVFFASMGYVPVDELTTATVELGKLRKEKQGSKAQAADVLWTALQLVDEELKKLESIGSPTSIKIVCRLRGFIRETLAEEAGL